MVLMISHPVDRAAKILTQADEAEDERSRDAKLTSDAADIFSTVSSSCHWMLLGFVGFTH